MKKWLFILQALLITYSVSISVVACANNLDNPSLIEKSDEINNLHFDNSATKASVISALKTIEAFKNITSADVFITIQKSTTTQTGFVLIESAPGSLIVNGTATIIIPKIELFPPVDEQHPLILKDYLDVLNSELGYLKSNHADEIAQSFYTMNYTILPDNLLKSDFYVFNITNTNAQITGHHNNTHYISTSETDAINVNYSLSTNSTDPELPILPGVYEQDSHGFYYMQNNDQNTYYKNQQNQIGETLKNSLKQTLHSGFQQQTYKNVTSILKSADLNLDHASLNGIYNEQPLGINAENVQWNKEHVWPKSRLHSSNTTGPGADAHNLRASQIQINSTRGNDYFSEDSQKGAAHSISGISAFYPGDHSKGDVARISFYMATMYADLGFQLTNDQTLLNNATRKYMGTLDLMLKWHKEDPVDRFEINRNNVIYQYQHNRNPFIDHPEFVHLIWENKTIADLTKTTTPFKFRNVSQITPIFLYNQMAKSEIKYRIQPQ